MKKQKNKNVQVFVSRKQWNMLPETLKKEAKSICGIIKDHCLKAPCKTTTGKAI